MARDEVILAIDQGTSSTKALLVDRHGQVVARASEPLGQTQPHPGWVEQSPAEVWAGVLAATRRCLDGHDPRSVAAVGISNQRESMVLWDRATGEPVAPLLGWQDQRTAARCAALAAEGFGDLVREVTGLPLDPMFSATKGGWLLDHADPDRRRSGRGELCLGTVDSWLLSRFGGEHVIEIGNAARTQLMDVRTGRWDPRLLELFGIPAEVLPRIVPSTGPFPAVRGLPPLPDGVPVTAVLGDSHAALFAHAGWRPGRVKATYGTGSSIMALSPDAAVAGTALCLTVAWATGDAVAHAVEGNIRSSGSTLRWLADVVGRTPAELADLAASASSDGVHLVPAFGGLSAPWWDSDAQAVLAGMTLGTRLPQIARAALESIAFQVEDVVAAAGHHEVLLADGGAAANPALMQIQADVSGREVHQSLVADLSALGAAHLAGLGAALWSRAELEDLDRTVRVFSPRNDTAERRRMLGAWHQAVSRARSSDPSIPGGTP
ncbi:FGGY-family carbohydrate kinase [Actinoallomurus iriomotensis]|uniref:ATP:glycerol 3-phosphotransferase n=1 Tax=Actinoallomurus iriomotensis TaxID=478107 RepID=A0A9W6VZC0_9ACTN|nr:FGGY family carbohydrate kinase [Actinoallomurus iriomotensis]GLY85194.1 glycerol kinase [Actinoallomurus iriomotensis]